jgi:hypothetical protein
MVGVDTLLVKSLDSVIKSNLSEKTLQKIENRLFEKYGISITQSLTEFHKLDEVLREFFGDGAEGLERQIFESICKFEKSKDKAYEWLAIEDQRLAKIILEAFGDDDKKKILTLLIEESYVISDILEKCNIPQTSGYRKINALINDGLLTTGGYVDTPDGKKITKYVTVFKNMKIDIIKNRITVKVMIGNDILSKSHLIPIIQRS